MKISISGSHGAGKTTLIRNVVRNHPEWKVQEEATRTIVPRLGYTSPYNIVKVNGIAIYEAMMIASWSSLLTETSHSVSLLDRSPIDNLAYYFYHRLESEHRHEELLTRLATLFLAEIDIVVFVPLLPFSVDLDAIQPENSQLGIQKEILRLYKWLGIEFVTLSSTVLENRTKELTLIIEQAIKVNEICQD